MNNRDSYARAARDRRIDPVDFEYDQQDSMPDHIHEFYEHAGTLAVQDVYYSWLIEQLRRWPSLVTAAELRRRAGALR